MGLFRAVCYNKFPKVKVICGSVPPPSYSLSPLKYDKY